MIRTLIYVFKSNTPVINLILGSRKLSFLLFLNAEIFQAKLSGFFNLSTKYNSYCKNVHRKNIRDVLLAYVLPPIHQLLFQKFCPIQKQQPKNKQNKTKRNTCRYLSKTTFPAYLIFYKFIIFQTLIIFLEPKIKLITGIFDLKK